MLYYERIFTAFQKHKLRYILAGGMAVNLHGVPRFTKDVDILIDISPQNLKRLRRVIKSLGLKPRMPVRLDEFLDPAKWAVWKKEKNLRALNLYNPKDPYEGLDILWDVGMTYEQAREDRKMVAVGALKIFLVSVPNLIRMKKTAGREQDRADIESLRKLQKIGKCRKKSREG
jgi:hypothetical protein